MPSSQTLAQLRTRTLLLLQDTGAATWATGDIDEALTEALDLYSELLPQRKIGTITLSAAGREIDVSSLTGYIAIERIWWDYDSTDPAHPPNWRDFELWPGDIVYINDDSEPSASDVIRAWYTLRHTLNGLRSASATTIPEDAETPLVIGAAAIAAQMRARETSESLTVDGWVGRRIRNLATQWLLQFNKYLNRAISIDAAKHSGIAHMDDLDRWDRDSEW